MVATVYGISAESKSRRPRLPSTMPTTSSTDRAVAISTARVLTVRAAASASVCGPDPEPGPGFASGSTAASMVTNRP
ncbi:hypothetical protein [Streptacidiphilus sp. PAMC 29251]